MVNPLRCTAHDQTCKEIAANAHDLMRCSVTLESAQRYLSRVLQLVHDTQVAVADGSIQVDGQAVAHRTDGHVW